METLRLLRSVALAGCAVAFAACAKDFGAPDGAEALRATPSARRAEREAWVARGIARDLADRIVAGRVGDSVRGSASPLQGMLESQYVALPLARNVLDSIRQAVESPAVPVTQGLAVASPDTVTAAEIRAAYAAIVRVEAVAPPDGDTILVLQTGPPPEGHLLASFYEAYLGWFVYLVHHARGFQLPGLDYPDTAQARPGRDAAALLQHQFVARLVADSQFNAVALPAIAAHLSRSGAQVDTALLRMHPDTLSPDQVMQVAVRFFYPDMIVDGRIYTHVCTELNAVRELPSRNLALEAMAFSVIMDQLRLGDSSQVNADVSSAIRLMGRLDSSGPDELRLNRAQGVMWGALFRSPSLRQVLIAEAQRMRGILPFVIQEP